MNEEEQSAIITFANLLIRSVSDFFSASKITEIIGDNPVKEIFFNADKKEFFEKKRVSTFPLFFNSVLFQDAVARIIDVLSKSSGFHFTESRLEIIYTELGKLYSVEIINRIIMPYIPEGYLEQHRVAYLSKEELEVRVLQKTKELQRLNNELEDKIKKRTIELKNLLKEQQESAKMLIRRDLELNRANERLLELDQKKSEFVTIAAHQLRTPLSGIKWIFSMLIKKELGPLSDDQITFIMKGYESNERMINLVDDMLNADRIDSGKYFYAMRPVQILDLFDNLLYEMAPIARKNKISIEYESRPAVVPRVLIDPDKMRAAIQNLIENAIKYTPAGGRILISFKVAPNNTLEVTISDTGIGIPNDQKQNIFNRFFRGRNAIKIETDGSGLGLFIVKSIIEKHGGRVWFESEENKGTAFHFTLKNYN